MKTNKTSRFIGVTYNKDSKKYLVYSSASGKNTFLGSFINEIDAALEYDKYVIRLNNYHRLNFPDPEPENLIPNTRLIRLTQGQFAIVDEEDYERVNAQNWCAMKYNNSYYAGCEMYGAKVKMHRFILNMTDGFVDHKNGNGLHNYKSNLRQCTMKENTRNRKPLQRKCSSKYKGVSLHYGKKYQAAITYNGVRKCIGTFMDEIEAAVAYDTEAKKLYGEFAWLNFKD